MTIPKSQRGFTLIELAITLAVLLVLLAIAMPDFGTTNDKRNLQGAAEALQQDLRFARAEAIKRNQRVRVAFKRNTATDWCWGMTLGATTCDCEETDSSESDFCDIDAGILNVTDSSEFENVEMVAVPSFSGGSAFTTISPTHGTASAGRVKLESGKGVLVDVVLSGLGRVWVCTDVASGATSGVKYGFEYDADCDPS